jgi:hypothetical protein
MSSEHLTVGQQVRVHSATSGRPIPAKIVRVGRSLVTIRYEGTDIQFRIDTRRRANRPRDSRTWFETGGEEPRLGREATAISVLRSAGVDVAVGHRVTLGLLEELAKAIRTRADHPDLGPWQVLRSWLRDMAARYGEARDEADEEGSKLLGYAYRGEADAYRKVLAMMTRLDAAER